MTSSRARRIGLAHLSVIDVDPPSLVDLAADAGYDFVGIRARAVTRAESPFDLSPGSPMLTDTVQRLADRAMACVDVEFILLDGTVTRADWLAVLDTAATLGAQVVTVSVNDPDDGHVLEVLQAMKADALDQHVDLLLEPITYNVVNSIPHALRLAESADCGILLDALHVNRFGASAEQIRAAAARVPVVQLCDGPADRPDGRDALVHESRYDRLAPGTGSFDLGMLLANLPSDLPVSIEVPSTSMRSRMSALDYVTYLRESTEALLDRYASKEPHER
jgi:sugar phosphate isomerase/epimerase